MECRRLGGKPWGQIPDNITIQFSELGTYGESIISYNQRHAELSSDGFEMKLTEDAHVYYKDTHPEDVYQSNSRTLKAACFTITVSTNWNNLNLRYYTRPGMARPDEWGRIYRNNRILTTGLYYYWAWFNRGDYRPFSANIIPGIGNLPEGHLGRQDKATRASANNVLPSIWNSPAILFSDIPKQSVTRISIPIITDVKPERDETFTVVFKEDSDDPQYGWTFTVTIKDDGPDRIPNVALDVNEHIVKTRTNFGRLVEIPEDSRQAFERFPLGYGELAGQVWAIQITGFSSLLFPDSGDP